MRRYGFLARGAGIGLILLAAGSGALAQKTPQKSQAETATEDGLPVRPKEEKMFPLKTPWLAASLNGKSYGTDRPTFTLDENYRIRGYGGCNTFSATAYPLKGQKFAVGPIALTRKACPEAVMSAERAFLTALRSSNAWDLDAGALVLTGQAGTLRFERSF